MFALAKPSGLAWGQAASLSVCLLPMSATAWVLALDFTAAHPEALPAVMPVLLTAIALVELAGPLAVLYALRHAKEVDLPEGGAALGTGALR